MGCLKMDISDQYFTALKVVKETSRSGENTRAGGYRFGFGGQEKVDEISGSGNHYTEEFWEYDPRVVKRWNTDPIVKPHESPYAVFANNPIWFIDPLGADTVEVFKGSGELHSHTPTEGDDVFFMVDKDDEGNIKRIDDYRTFDDGTLEKVYSQNTQDDETGKWHPYDIYRIRGDENATELFKFFANNTDVEWSQTLLGEAGKRGLNYLTTSHDFGTEWGVADMLYTQFRHDYTVRGHTHSHPLTLYGYIPYPSKADKNLVKWIKKYTQTYKPVFKIYTPSDKQFHEYDEEGQINEE